MATLTSAIAIAGYAQRISAIASGSVYDASYPATNLLLPRLSDMWRSPVGSLSAVKLYFDLGGSKTDLDHFALHGVNLTLAATRKVRVATALTAFSGGAGSITHDSTTGAAFDTTDAQLLDPTPPWGRTALYLPSASVTGAFVEWTITDATLTTPNYLDASLALVGPNWQPAKSFDPTWTQEDEPAGQPGMEKVLRRHVLTLHRLTRGEANQVLTMARNLKRTGRVLVIPQPLTPATWLQTVVLAEIESYRWSGVPQLPDRRAVTITFREVDD